MRTTTGLGGACRAGAAGVTLIELMITIAVLATLVMVGVPGMSSLLQNSRLTSYANEFVASVALARSEAIKRNAVVSVCVSADGTNCAVDGWQSGWIVRAADGTVLRRTQALASGYLFKNVAGTVLLQFSPAGIGSTPVSLTLCQSSAASTNQRVVVITASGQSSVTRATGTCT